MIVSFCTNSGSKEQAVIRKPPLRSSSGLGTAGYLPAASNTEGLLTVLVQMVGFHVPLSVCIGAQ